MTSAAIRNLEWGPVKDWSSVPMTHYDKLNKRYISKNDINSFLTDYIKSIARKFGVDFKFLYNLITQENEAFYTMLDDIFKTYSGLGSGSDEFELLKQYFKVPYLPQKDTDPVNDLLISFERLTDIQKLEVLSRLKLISIEIKDNSERNKFSQILVE